MTKKLWAGLLLITSAALAGAAGYATLEVNSEEGWCMIYIDGAEAGEIPLNSHRTVIRNIEPGEHFLRVTDAFDKEWFNEVVYFPAGVTLRAKAEPTGVTIINKPTEPPAPEPSPPPSPGGVTKVKTNFTSYKQIPVTLFVTSSPAGATVTVDGRTSGATPLLRTDLAAGKHIVKVAEVEEEVDLKMGGLTQLDVTFDEGTVNPDGTRK